MEQIITRHIQNVVGHYKGQCYAWDVVNEAMEDDGTYRQNPCKADYQYGTLKSRN